LELDLGRFAGVEIVDHQARMFIDGVYPGEAVRDPRVTEKVSTIAAMPEVRQVLVQHQRSLTKLGSLVMEGRDIGSVVFPNADLKIFLDAVPEERARRRAAEVNGDRDSVASQIRERDKRDRTRTEAPLTQAPDAVYVDSTGKSIEEVEGSILRLVRARITNGKEFS